MTDPNLRRLLDFTKSEANDNYQRDAHCFAFLKKGDIADKVKGNKEQFLNNQRYILENLGVRVIWYNKAREKGGHVVSGDLIDSSDYRTGSEGGAQTFTVSFLTYGRPTEATSAKSAVSPPACPTMSSIA